MARIRHWLITPAFILSALVGIFVTGIKVASAAEADRITIYAAASLKNALDDVIAKLQSETGIKATAVYAGSSALARQIEAGAPADIFISADENWMDDLAGKNLIATDTRRDLLANTLVLIAPKERPISLTIEDGFPLAAALGSDRLALGNSESVPAGRYAKAALQSLGVWESIKDKRAETENVRAALALVAAAETPLGIVYQTDAIAEPKVIVVGVFPAGSHPPIIYPIARIHSATSQTETSASEPDAAQRALTFLTSRASLTIFAQHGFRSAPAASQEPAP